jgi:hypothetical protein
MFAPSSKIVPSGEGDAGRGDAFHWRRSNHRDVLPGMRRYEEGLV